MAMNDSREGEVGEAVRSLVRRRCLMALGMAGWGQLANFFLLEKLAMYIKEQQMLVIIT
jgi:hypothetical protein